MLTGQNPWGNRLDSEANVLLALKTRLSNLERPAIPENVSPECQNFIDRCLQHDFELRPYARELLEDPWIKHGSLDNSGVSHRKKSLAKKNRRNEQISHMPGQINDRI